MIDPDKGVVGIPALRPALEGGGGDEKVPIDADADDDEAVILMLLEARLCIFGRVVSAMTPSIHPFSSTLATGRTTVLPASLVLIPVIHPSLSDSYIVVCSATKPPVTARSAVLFASAEEVGVDSDNLR